MEFETIDDIDELPGEKLIFWVITHGTKDYGDKFVVRRQVPVAGKIFMEKSCEVCDTIEEARAKVPPGATRMLVDQDDDPVIVESWMR